MKIIKEIQLKIVIFTAVKNRCILRGCVFVMQQVGEVGEEGPTLWLCSPARRLIRSDGHYFCPGMCLETVQPNIIEQPMF